MAARKDLLSGLRCSLDADTDVAQKHFKDADRFTSVSPTGPARRPRRRGTIRDTFSFPRDDHRLFEELRQRCCAGGFSASKSELVRAGLGRMPPAAFAYALAGLEKLKPGPAPRRAVGTE